MHSGGELEPAQPLCLVRNDALRLLLVVRPTGKDLASGKGVIAPVHVHAGVNAHVFEVVACAARACVVKHAIFGVHHNVGGVEGRHRGGCGCGSRGGRHQLVRILIFIGRCRSNHGGIPQRRHGDSGFRIVGHRKVAVIHVAAGGAESGVQVAGRRRRQQVLALGHIQ